MNLLVCVWSNQRLLSPFLFTTHPIIRSANGAGCDSEMDVMALRADHLGKTRIIIAQRQGFRPGQSALCPCLGKVGQ